MIDLKAIMSWIQTRIPLWLLIFSAYLANGGEAFAFPTLVNHGYTSCITCHVAPSGGGALNSYGKYVANELFSMWDDSESAIPWIKRPENPEGFGVMIQSRAAQTYFDTPMVTRGDLRLMQADAELSYLDSGWVADVAVGPRVDSATNDQKPTDIFVRRFYAGHASLTHAVRIGRFFPEFGINYYNHNVPTRKGLYFNHNEEPLIAQASLYSPTFDYTLGIFKGSDGTSLNGETGGNANVIYKSGSTRTGVSLLALANSEYAASIHTQVGFFRHGYIITEWARKGSFASTKTTLNHLSFTELGWEITRGLTGYAGFQTTENLVSETSSQMVPIGLKFYPFSHFELIGEVAPTNFSMNGESIGSGTSAYLMLNVYF